MKRFTDTGIWVDKSWFLELSPAEKCAWFFIKDRCDNVGVWNPNFKMAELTIGAKIDWDALLNKLNNNIEVLENGKWWLKDFCDFQYGELKEDFSKNKIYQSYIKSLKKHGLWEKYQEYPKDLAEYSKDLAEYPKDLAEYPKDLAENKQGPKDKEKDKEKEKEKDKELEKEKEKEKEGTGAEAKECLKFYLHKHKEIKKYEPITDWGRDMKIFKRILKKYDVAAVKEVIECFFGWDKRSDFTTKALYNRFDVLYGVLKDKAEGRR